MNSVKQKCIVTNRGGGFSQGKGFCAKASGSDSGVGAGGPAVQPGTKPLGTGTATNRMKAQAGRRNSREVHHNGGTRSISMGSTNPPR